MIAHSKGCASRSRWRIIVLVLLFAAVSVTLSGCRYLLIFAGRGDYEIELFNGYYITRVNSRCIVLSYKDDPEASGSSAGLDRFFITGYQLYEPYIGLAGIDTHDVYITDEELDLRVTTYYLIDTVQGNVAGPFESIDAYTQYCATLNLDVREGWIQPKGK